MKNKILFLLLLAFILCGCVMTKPNPILTSKDQSWFIPKGVKFEAKKKPEEELKTYLADDDLMVLYFGKYLEVEKLADECVKKNCAQ